MKATMMELTLRMIESTGCITMLPSNVESSTSCPTEPVTQSEVTGINQTSNANLDFGEVCKEFPAVFDGTLGLYKGPPCLSPIKPNDLAHLPKGSQGIIHTQAKNR